MLTTKRKLIMKFQGIFKPVLYFPEHPQDARAYHELLEQNKSVLIIDHIGLMIAELIKTRNPGVSFSETALQLKTAKFLGDKKPENYGVWVYYPWLNRMVHVLAKEDFIELRTSRNQYKILPEEQKTLRTKKIGIVGLSVGQSVAVTMALERCGGVFRLADFDVLELSNMNRIRSGVHEIGELKVVNTAREILEIDPFLDVEIFPQGLQRDNMEAFFLENGQLDLVIDECDSLDVKLLLREYARKLRIPVLMDTSDRGMLDVERFDEEPNRPILHGFVGDLKADELGDLTTEQKIPYILKIVGVETMSERMKVSMMEVEQSIRTWPQLASNVVLGGGITCDVARRLLLNYGVKSGRYFTDLEEIIPDERAKMNQILALKAAEDPVVFNYRPYNEFSRAFKNIPTSPSSEEACDLSRDLITALVKDATQAPSGGNMQSWIWDWSNRQLFLLLDADRTVKLVDYQALGTLSGLGAAAESLVLSAHEKGLYVKITPFPSADFPEWVATFEFFETPQPGCEKHDYDDLYALLPVRQCNRTKATETISTEKLEQIRSFAAGAAPFNLVLLTDKAKIGQLGTIAGTIDRLRFTQKAYHSELVKEIRWTPEEAARTKDGIDLDLIDLKASEKVGFELAKQWPLMEIVASLKGGRAIEKMTRELLETDSAIGLITTPEISPLAYFNGGRYYQRLWLYCTKIGLDWHPIPATLYAFLRLNHEKNSAIPEPMRAELMPLSQQFQTLFSTTPETGCVLLMRLVPARRLPLASYRRPVEEVLFFG